MKLLAVMIGSMAMLAGTAFGAEYKFKLAHEVAIDSTQHLAATHFAKLVKERTNGNIEINIFPNSGLGPAQQAFVECHGLQCGFCTPGMVMSAVDLAQTHGRLDEKTVREGLEGNICRCTGYHNIVKAVLAGAEAMRADVPKAAE